MVLRAVQIPTRLLTIQFRYPYVSFNAYEKEDLVREWKLSLQARVTKATQAYSPSKTITWTQYKTSEVRRYKEQATCGIHFLIVKEKKVKKAMVLIAVRGGGA